MTREMKTNYGPWAVVTGASSGIGKAIAQQLASLGLNLVLVARRGDALSELAKNLMAETGIETMVVPTDLADRRAVKALLEQTEDLDIGLFVAAAGFGTSGPAAFIPMETEENMVDVNVTAVVMMTQRYAQRFSVQRRGGIILFGSLLGKQGVPGSANYSATKGYMHALGEALARELKPRNVDVLVCAPGPVATEFAGRANMNLSFSAKPDAVAAQTLRTLGRKSYVAPTFTNAFLQFVFNLTPRSIRVRITERIMAQMIGSTP